MCQAIAGAVAKDKTETISATMELTSKGIELDFSHKALYYFLPNHVPPCALRTLSLLFSLNTYGYEGKHTFSMWEYMWKFS